MPTEQIEPAEQHPTMVDQPTSKKTQETPVNIEDVVRRAEQKAKRVLAKRPAGSQSLEPTPQKKTKTTIIPPKPKSTKPTPKVHSESSSNTNHPTFLPPKSKSTTARKQCICSWGETCCQFTTFFEKEKHPLAGVVDFNYSETSCNFLNVWESICQLLNVSQSVQEEIQRQYEQSKVDPKVLLPRIKVARFHYPYEIVTNPKRGSYMEPMTKEVVEHLKCYGDRIDPPFHLDPILKYDPTLGKGASVRLEKKTQGAVLIRVAPTATRESVYKIAAVIQNAGPRERETMRSLAEKDAKIYKLEVEVGKLETIKEKRDAKICDLETKLSKLQNVIESKDKQITIAKRKAEVWKKQVEKVREGRDNQAKLIARFSLEAHTTKRGKEEDLEAWCEQHFDSESEEEEEEKTASATTSPKKMAPYSELEKRTLLEGIEKFGVGKWKQILQHNPHVFQPNGRTASDLAQYHQSFLGQLQIQKKSHYSELEKRTLLEGIEKFGVGKWKKIRNQYRHVFQPNGRTARDLQRYYQNCLKQLKHHTLGETSKGKGPVPFSELEKSTLLEGVEKFGVGAWQMIHCYYQDVFKVNARTSKNLREYYDTLFPGQQDNRTGGGNTQEKEEANSDSESESNTKPKRVYTRKPRDKVPWTDGEKQALQEGVDKFGVGKWMEILSYYKDVFKEYGRNNQDLSNFYRRNMLGLKG